MQRGEQRGAIGRPCIGILFQRAHRQRGEASGHRIAALLIGQLIGELLRPLREMRHHHVLRGCLVVEGVMPGEQLIGDDAPGVHVGARVDVVAGGLFGGHVRRRA
jgi:hypothetical protein